MSHLDRELSDIDRILREMQRKVDSASTAERVDAGHALQLLISTTKKVLDKVKDSLRRDSAGKSPTHSTTILEGATAVASVSPPEPITRLAKNADVASLRKALGDDFGDYFQEQHLITPRPEALHRILTLPPDVKDIVLRSLEQDVGSGGVGFNPKRRT